MLLGPKGVRCHKTSGRAELTGTWLDKGKLPGLFFLLLVVVVPPPPLMVLPPDILRFRRLFGACLDGSATEGNGWELQILKLCTLRHQGRIYATMLDGNEEM